MRLVVFEECARVEGWGVSGQERQWCEIVWALRQPEEKEVGFRGDMGDPVDEVGVVAAGVKRFALHVDSDRT